MAANRAAFDFLRLRALGLRAAGCESLQGLFLSSAFNGEPLSSASPF
jgi:hypothetical protein